MPGPWHLEWQARFLQSEITCDAHDACTKRRRIDACSANGTWIEFQHSLITGEELAARRRDYAVHGKDVLWVVDGQDVEVKTLDISERFMLVFGGGSAWMYESFQCAGYEHVYLHVDEYVYRVGVADVRCHMVDVAARFCVDLFVEWVNSLDRKDLWGPPSPPMSTLYFCQRGAGCGKTYESVQLCTDPRFNHKTTFVYLTKMHSAKDVILQEWQAQVEEGALRVVDIAWDDTGKKQHRAQFIKPNGEEAEVVIGTIDSFMYAMGNKSVYGKDVFESMVNSIRDGFRASMTSTGGVRFGGGSVDLNMRTLIVVDEAQDLQVNYIEALSQIMRNTLIDVYVIGDKLQSLFERANIHTHLEFVGLPFTRIVRTDSVNLVRRFQNRSLANFVNAVVPFDRFGLPSISTQCDDTNEEAVTLFRMSDDAWHLEASIAYVLDCMRDEVQKHAYLPNQFMLIFSYVRKNPFACLLEAAIQDFWVQQMQDEAYLARVREKWSPPEFAKFVYFHKSVENEPINLEESKDATRLLSIHASKGTGREVVFVFNLNVGALHCFRCEHRDLKFESLVHVALTRVKRKMYIALDIDKTNDVLAQRLIDASRGRIHAFENAAARPEANKSCKLDTVVDDFVFGSDANFETVRDALQLQQLERQVLTDAPLSNQALLDYSHHIIRYSVMMMTIAFRMFNDAAAGTANKDDVLRQSVALRFKHFYTTELRIEYFDAFKKTLGLIWSKKAKKPVIPLLAFHGVSESLYQRYTKILRKCMNHVQRKVERGMNATPSPCLSGFCPLELVLLNYGLSVKQKDTYTALTIMDVYHILSCYDLAFRHANVSHAQYDCKCDTEFGRVAESGFVATTSFSNDICLHHERVQCVTGMFERVCAELQADGVDTASLRWVQDKKIEFMSPNPTATQFVVKGRVDFQGRNESDAVHLIVLPQLQSLNFKRVWSFAAFARFVMIHDHDVNHCIRFHTFIVTLNMPRPVRVNLGDLNVALFQGMTRSALLQSVCRVSPVMHAFYVVSKQQNADAHRSGVRAAHDDLFKLYFDLPERESQRELFEYLLNLDERMKHADAATRRELASLDGFVADMNAFWAAKVDQFFSAPSAALEDGVECDW